MHEDYFYKFYPKELQYKTIIFGVEPDVYKNLNSDFKNREKFKIVNSIVPISISLFSNSSIVEKKKSDYLSYRSKVWQNTSRRGLPKLFLEDLNFEKYADFIINFKILFIHDKENYISGQKYTFGDFMSGKISEIGNRLPTEHDLSTHLSTIFTENRLKKYIELRSMDTCGWDCLCAGPAFNIGMLYGNLDEVYDLISKWDKDKIINAYLEAPKKGFNTQLMGKDLLYWASTLLNRATPGRQSQNRSQARRPWKRRAGARRTTLPTRAAQLTSAPARSRPCSQQQLQQRRPRSSPFDRLLWEQRTSPPPLWPDWSYYQQQNRRRSASTF